MYLVKHLGTNTCHWVHHCNSKNNVKKGTVFIGAIYKNVYRHSVSVCRSTSVSFLEKPKKTKREIRIRRYVNKLRFKRERPVYRWFEQEIEKIQEEVNKEYQEMDKNICALNLPDIKIKPKYIFNLIDKQIKTTYGQENDLYSKNFEMEIDIYEGKIHKDFKSLRKFSNNEEFKNAKFPLYEVNHNGTTYLFNKNDFNLIENKQEIKEIEKINIWEENVIKLENKARKIRKWKDRCIQNIKKDLSLKYGIEIRY